MYEQNNIPSDESTGQRQDAIDINDFVFAATGARVRRLTMPDGEHWFVAADVATELGYANTRQALDWHVAATFQSTLDDLARTVYGADGSSKIAGHGLKKSMRMVTLQGLVALVNGCTKPECDSFKAWVSEVIATIQRDGSYSLEPAAVQPAPSGSTAYVMPDQVADAIVRLEERNIRADEMILAFQKEQNDLLRQMTDALKDIAGALRSPGPRSPEVTPADLLATWRTKNLIVTDDVHSVAAVLAPALLRGEAHYRIEEIATRTGLPHERVHDCLRMLLKRGCMRQTGCAADGAPVYVLP
ncbi:MULTISPECIES: BRO-N domain-containing protein [Streptomyces]|uniref:BRO-N domain-containing protein n=1 Tax=Streptomyces TaxID=1883 RepID=UPI0015877DB6|nr:Bro-N domain-containing protein [Streptomyces sp. CAI-85]NUV61516.1 Bro-N domain-containing protein [Streptomyces sp. CAI-85]